MKKSLGPSKKGKGIAAGLVVCFVAAIAMVGTYTFNQYKDGMQEELSQLEDKGKNVNQDTVINVPREPVAEEPPIMEEVPTEEPVKTETPPAEKPASNKSKQINFKESDLILWPVDGDVLMGYSMNKTVYFSTLDQYKYNPALIIGGKVGEPVASAAKGIVKSINVTAQTGTTVAVDLGNGYEAIYGQLKEVPVKMGDYVEKETVLGYLSEPTKYYSVEGCNLYFEMRKDGQPVNPMDYIEK